MKNYLLISGSPRNGNTNFILSNIFEKIKGRKDLVFLRDKKINHCLGCLNCHKNSECVIKDDMTSIREIMQKSDVIILGTPNYFDNVSGLLKNFIDRCHPFYKFESLKGKKLILIMTGGGKIEGTKKYLVTATHGFVRYLKFDIAGLFCFSAMQATDLKQNPKSKAMINKIVDIIKYL